MSDMNNLMDIGSNLDMAIKVTDCVKLISDIALDEKQSVETRVEYLMCIRNSTVKALGKLGANNPAPCITPECLGIALDTSISSICPECEENLK